MVTSMESVLLLDEAEALAKMITESELAIEYRRSLYNLQNDQEAQTIIQKFVKIKEQYEDVMRFGKYHPDYNRIKSEMREIKRELDLNDKVAAFKKAEKEIQKLLDEISMYIGRAVSTAIKVPTGNPYFEMMPSCGCASGGACGCSA
ncbi:MAG: YlbF family regulator [Bacillaceae bacterium]|jgi:Uncharacterized conserved protein|uniref:Regulator n=2 Tax=Aeribacillus TaxID=1055323 RepID=A0A165X9Y1_9BACI|nr:MULTISPECIES: YlbF family regulator [Aeribacillus]AXI39961.1 YlbF family regulator [Bacillaceae bacterium ZC4]REJ20418.1 MAG: YlbF family regulator [Bacillaceae bacterium]ASS91674.1 regulator [Aeribacillus pallidus]KZM52635.1 regulator [Aeribacillus pallidus]KZN95784.1 regulator [Aeribacillus pallidus]